MANDVQNKAGDKIPTTGKITAPKEKEVKKTVLGNASDKSANGKNIAPAQTETEKAASQEKSKATPETVKVNSDKSVSPNEKADAQKPSPIPAPEQDKGKKVIPLDKNKMVKEAGKPIKKKSAVTAKISQNSADDREPWEKSYTKLEAEKKNARKIPISKQEADKAKVQSAKEKQKTDKVKPVVKSPSKADKGTDKQPEKAPPIEEGPTLAERKEKLEKELREKFNIPKAAKTVAAWVAPEVEQVVRIPHKDLHSFKDHPFNVDNNAKYKAFVVSIRAQGVTQPAIIRPREAGGYEIISGHRRDEGSKDAGIPFTPCIIRALNDDQAIQQMVEDNVNNREIGTMELAKALNMQLESIKHQGAQDSLSKDEPVSADDVNKRSNAIIAERNGMSVKQVQRHINLTRLVPALQELVDGKPFAFGDKTKVLKIGFTPAVELSAIKQKDLQEYIAVAIEGQQAAPSLSQAQRMRKMADQNILKPDMIDGIMTEEKKEVDRVIISTEELAQFFGKDKTPREMKETIITLLDEWKGKQKDISTPQRKNEHEK